MWLFIPEGFFSIVTAEEFGYEVQVRSRSKVDLNALRDKYFPSLTEPVHLSDRDYQWRSFCTKVDLAECLSNVALSLDYSNFKSAVAHRHSHVRAHTYGRVWSACYSIQDEGEGPYS